MGEYSGCVNIYQSNGINCEWKFLWWNHRRTTEAINLHWLYWIFRSQRLWTSKNISCSTYNINYELEYICVYYMPVVKWYTIKASQIRSAKRKIIFVYFSLNYFYCFTKIFVILSYMEIKKLSISKHYFFFRCTIYWLYRSDRVVHSSKIYQHNFSSIFCKYFVACCTKSFFSVCQHWALTKNK